MSVAVKIGITCGASLSGFCAGVAFEDAVCKGQIAIDSRQRLASVGRGAWQDLDGICQGVAVDGRRAFCVGIAIFLKCVGVACVAGDGGIFALAVFACVRARLGGFGRFACGRVAGEDIFSIASIFRAFGGLRCACVVLASVGAFLRRQISVGACFEGIAFTSSALERAFGFRGIVFALCRLGVTSVGAFSGGQISIGACFEGIAFTSRALERALGFRGIVFALCRLGVTSVGACVLGGDEAILTYEEAIFLTRRLLTCVNFFGI